MKRALFLFLFVALLLPTSVFATSADNVSVYYDGKKMDFEVPAQVIDGSTMVPFRAIFEKMGLEITWEPVSQTVTGSRQGLIIQMTIGSPDAYANGRHYTLPVSPLIKGGSTLIPLRFVSEVSGKMVSWDGKRYRVDINKGYEEASTNNPLGGTPFMPMNSNQADISARKSMYQAGDTLYVFWGYPETAGDYQFYQHRYIKYKDGKWDDKISQLAGSLMSAGHRFMELYQDGSLYIQNGSTITKHTFEENKITSSTMASGLYSSDTGSFRVVFVDGQQALLYFPNKPEGKILVYKDNAVIGEIKDFYNVLASFPQTSPLIFDPKKSEMLLTERTYYRVLDTSTGDMRYNSQGHDLQVSPVKDLSDAMWVAQNGNIYFMYADLAGARFVSKFNSNTRSLGEPVVSFLNPAVLTAGNFIITDKYIRQWTVYTFARREAIQTLEYSR